MTTRFRSVAIVCSAVALGGADAWAASCGRPSALGVSRVVVVNPRTTPVVGSHQYGARLPLAPGEVVLTFDDGPRPPYTNQVLKALADECLRATFFMVGRQANAYPHIVRQVRDAGHTVGTHTQNHLYRMSSARSVQEIDAGIASVGAALGPRGGPAPFFRFPGLKRTREAERHLRARGIVAWSVDVDSYDWKRHGANHMLNSTVARLEAQRGGILLMHDVKSKTAHALPRLIAMLKARGFRVVHVVPGGHFPAGLMAMPSRRQPVIARRADLQKRASR